MNWRLGSLLFVLALLIAAPATAFGQEDESSEDTGEIPPPSGWKPSGEITEPGPTAGVEEGEATIPDPMIQYGEFQLNFHGRIQGMVGLVGDD